MAAEREHAESSGTENATVAKAAGLRSAGPEAQLRAAIGFQQGVSNRAVARAAAAQLLAREPAPLAEHSSAVNTAVTGQAFVQGAGDIGDIDANDVRQGLLGDCNLLAPAAAIARANPEAIRRLITPNTDGSYNVTLYYKDHFWSDLTAHTLRVTSQFYMGADGSPIYARYGDTGASGPELWVMLIEKAFARYRGSYTAAGGALWDREGLELLTGNPASELGVGDGTPAELLTMISDALREGKAITVNTSTSRWQNWTRTAAEQAEITRYNIKLDHAYSIEAVDTAAQTLNLRNPWGFSHITNLPVSMFRRYFNTWSRVSVR